MNEPTKEQVKYKLKQVKDIQQRLDICKQDLEFLLAESEKPKLRHGDYGQFPEGNWWVVLMRKQKLEVFGGLSGAGSSSPTHLTYCAKIHKGLNFFDDLKALAEPLEEFVVSARNVGSGFVANIPPDDDAINLGTTNDTWNFTFAQAEEIHSKLGRLILTAKNK